MPGAVGCRDFSSIFDSSAEHGRRLAFCVVKQCDCVGHDGPRGDRRYIQPVGETVSDLKPFYKGAMRIELEFALTM